MPATDTYDLLVIGSGIAGLSAAIRAADEGLRVVMVTKGDLAQGSTRWAQGGVAAVLDDEDSIEEHVADTLAAGGDLCDEEAVRVLVGDGPARVRGLIDAGAAFDRLTSGALSMAREGGHSRARIVHAGGAATGVEIERTLVRGVGSTGVHVLERCFALDVIVDGPRCVGIVAIDESGRRLVVNARHTLLAAGGTGQLFAVTTNPHVATGDGIAMALRAGVAVADIEFVQFHPTALHHPVMPRPLLSEAMRGHGAVLLDTFGERFVDELSPRDIVARAITITMREQQADHLWLDATGLADVRDRFPTITRKLDEVGLDVTTDRLPIAPAAHYHCGGVMTDVDGATMLPGLWAAGEVACVGVHGANRLASNSLLEGMVFAHRSVMAIVAGRDGPQATGVLRGLVGPSDGPIGSVPIATPVPEPAMTSSMSEPTDHIEKLRDQLQVAMSLDAGVLRTAESLAVARDSITSVAAEVGTSDDVASWELRNLVTVGASLVHAAMLRTETRGSHSRDDHPTSDDALRVRFVHRPEDAR